MANVDVEKVCPWCGKVVVISCDVNAHAAWLAGELVQRAFPDMDKFDREALVSGMCHDCSSKVFNEPKPGEDWGERVGSCPICGASIYPKNATDDGYVCPACVYPMRADEIEE